MLTSLQDVIIPSTNIFHVFSSILLFSLKSILFSLNLSYLSPVNAYITNPNSIFGYLANPKFSIPLASEMFSHYIKNSELDPK